MTTKRICTRCVIDTTVPGVTFDENGVCNYCKIHNSIEQDWPQGEAGQQRVEAIVKKIKAQGEGKDYDCIVGVSGGTDSTYTLYLTKELGLRPLAVYFDNGWSTEISVRNIKRALSKLDVDLQTYVVDWEEFKDLQKAFLKASFAWADAPTDKAITTTLYRVAKEEGLKHIIVGRSFRTEGKMPREWCYSDTRTVNYIQENFGTKPLQSFPNMTPFELFRYNFIDNIKYILLLNYVDYSKAKTKEFLQKELDWEYYGGHHYENIYTRFVYSYLLPQKFGIDKRKITHSALVRNNEITRSEALNIVQTPPLPGNKLEEDIEYVIKKLGLTHEEFDEIMTLPPKDYRDYPSYFPLFEFFSPLIKVLSGPLLSWTPPFIREIEGRKQQKDKFGVS
ncbi:N-acetyl sugar amidotransferase [Chloroflexota bacterium]